MIGRCRKKTRQQPPLLMTGPRGQQLKYYANERQAVHTLSDKLLGHGTHLFALLTGS